MSIRREDYCCEPLELVENYAAAKSENFKGWCIHHRLEIQPDGTILSAKELIDHGLYFGRPASELVFMRNGEHHRLHWIGNTFNIGKHHSAETRQKMSEALKGKHHSVEHRQKLSESLKDRTFSAEHRQKLSEALKGENNPLFGKHHSAETRLKMSKSLKGKHWWNNGISSTRSRECPGEGWTRGRLRCK